MRTTLSVACQAVLGFAGAALAIDPAAAQTQVPNAAYSTAKPSTGSGKSADGWRVTPALQVDLGYDDNIYLLGSTKKADVATPSAAEVASGRYANMESANDVLTTLSTSVAVKGPGLMGKTSQLSPALDYELYTRNSERNNLRLGLTLEQELWADSRLRLGGRITPSYFAKNYLSDAVDRNLDGSIAADERVYSGGEYRETEAGADYRLPLARATRKHPLGVALQVAGGYYGRRYKAPFPGRDLNGPTGEAALLFDLGRRVSVDLGYESAWLSATTTDQVLLLDEADFGRDLNANGTATDLNVRTVTAVDRSRREQSLGAALRFDLGKAADLGLGYEHRWRRYTSTEPLDVSNKGRRDARNQLSADLRLKLAKHLRVRLGATHSSQSLNRTGDPGSSGEVDDYTRNQGSLGLSYQL